MTSDFLYVNVDHRFSHVSKGIPAVISSDKRLYINNGCNSAVPEDV
jgi:hypothetical protein